MADKPTATDNIITLEKPQLRPAADVLTRAFFDDPLYFYWYPVSEERARRTPTSFLSAFRYALRYGINMTTSSNL